MNTKIIYNEELDNLAINNIKTLGIDMITSAQSGHPGIVLGAAPIIYTLYSRHMIFDKNNPNWIDRDRFVMSCGHGSALLYATLFMMGFLSIEDLKNFRHLGSNTPGHPEIKTPGVDASTGLLGQGIANAVGMAIAERYLSNRYSLRKDKSIIDHYTYVLCSDGDLMEGISYEACSIAGNLGLGKLIILYDSNNITLDGTTNDTFKENVSDRFKAMNFDVQLVKNGTSIEEIDSAIKKAKLVSDKPSFIEIKTILGRGSINENTNIVHGKPLSEEDIESLKNKLGIRNVMFTVYDDSLNYVNKVVEEKNQKELKLWNDYYEKVLPKLENYKQNEILKLMNKDYSFSDKKLYFDKDDILSDEGRNISSIILNRFIDNENIMVGGSADLATSTKTHLKNEKKFTNTSIGKNLLFGCREQAMGGILNGICLSGIRCFGSTFLAFADYLKPSIKMAALMKLPIIYFLTHDSVLIGQDGPTHQPIDELNSLRLMPNVTVYRPYDANEILGSYKSALNNLEGPSVIVISKNYTEISDLTNINDVDKGAYYITKYDNADGIIIATGTEVKIAIEVSNKLKEIGTHVNVISMPSMERFFKQEKTYQNNILLKIKRLAIEFGSPNSWYKFVRSNKNIIGMKQYGISGTKEELEVYYKLDFSSIYDKAKKLFK